MDINNFLKSAFSTKVVGVELGVYEGDNAVRLCNNGLNYDMLYLVDPYIKYSGYTCYSGHSQEAWAGIERTFMDKFGIKPGGKSGRNNGQSVTFMKMLSVDAAKEFEDHSIDFVYLDANHAYEYVKEDLETWYDKVKPGGWVMGHDWPHPTVQRAVNEFMAARRLEFHPKSGHLHGWHDWWFQR